MFIFKFIDYWIWLIIRISLKLKLPKQEQLWLLRQIEFSSMIERVAK